MVFANKCIQNYFQTFFFWIELSLCCYAQAFSSCGELGLYSICSVWASHYGGFFCCGAWPLGCMGFSSYGAPWYVELPRPGMEPMSLALADGFLPTVPQG